MRLIDTHTHAWGQDTPELPWQGEVLPPEWTGAYTHERLIGDMDRVGVDESVIVTTPIYGRGRRANEYTMRSIEAHLDRLYGVALMDFFQERDEDVRETLRRVTGHHRMLGVRMHAAMEYDPIPTEVNRQADWFLDEALTPFWDAVATSGTAVFVFPKAQQLPDLAELIAAHPEVTFVVDHMAWPDETTSANSPPWTVFEEISKFNNVHVKISSLPRSSETSWPYEDLHGYVRNLIEWFGASRLMLGSDYPWMDKWADYGDTMSWIETVDGISRRDRAYVSYRTFDRLFG